MSATSNGSDGSDGSDRTQRIVITGAGGLVGRKLAARAAERGHVVVALTSADCDITDPAAVAARVSPHDVVVNCAAYTRVDDAERDEVRALAVNATGARHVARACADVGARLIHVSTDYVFSGQFSGPPQPYETDDETGPVSVYGRSKLAGELAVLGAQPAVPDFYVVRTAWIFSGGSGRDFVGIMRDKAINTAATVEVVADQTGSPTYVGDLVETLLQLASGTVRGPLLHAANAGQASRYEQARAVFELMGADPDRVRPVGTDRHPRPAPRPAYSALSQQRSIEAGMHPLRPWREALAAALHEDGPLPSTP